jgi:hypothetical protein
MASSDIPDRLILKVLSVVQIGAEVSLKTGEYLLGSGPDDDIQFIDVSVKPGHARLRVGPTGIGVRAEADAITIGEGQELTPKDDWREIQPLDKVRLGAVSFALGLPSAQWSTIAEEIHPRPKEEQPAAKPVAAKSPWKLASRLPEAYRPMVIPLATALGLIAFAIWFAVGGNRSAGGHGDDAKRDFEIVRQALEKFPFAKQLETRQEIDGTIYVNGYVTAPVERRAALGAIDKTGVPARVRIEVLDHLRSELDNLIAEEKVRVAYTLSPTGELTLTGIIISETEAQKFLARVQDTVIGLKKVVSKIKTSKTLFADIERLAHVSQIDQKIVLRLEQNVVEANGVINTDKIDAWVGFLQAYGRQFSADIGLRSYVMLQYDRSVDGSQLPQGGAGRPITLGGDGGALDLDKLRDGTFKLGDVFAGMVGAEQARDAHAASILEVSDKGRRGSANGAADAASKAAAEAAAKAAEAARAQRAAIVAQMLLADKGGAPNNAPCRRGSHMTPESIPPALEVLDRLSTTPNESLTAVEPARLRVALEVALDPSLASQCLQRLGGGANSTYLAEIARNPGFVEVVTRELPIVDLEVSGVNLQGKRYVQTRNGLKLFEGAAPDLSSRLDVIGELGLAIRTPSGYARSLFGRAPSWVMGRPLSAGVAR